MGGIETVFKKDLIKYLSAFVMGDAGIYYSGINCRMVTNGVQEEYLMWKKGILEELTSVNYHIVNDKRGSRQPLHVLTTMTHPTYTKIRERVYTNQYRGIDPHYLKLLDWESLAILFMDDGSCCKDNRCDATPSVSINTKRLSYADSWLLKRGIKESLGIEFNVHRQKSYYYLRLRSADYAIFKDNISQYILKCFEYKLL